MRKVIKVKDIKYVMQKNGIWITGCPDSACVPANLKIEATEWVRVSASVYDFANRVKHWIETGTGLRVASFILVNAHRLGLPDGEKNLQIVYVRGT